jgi:hypothetical protein
MALDGYFKPALVQCEGRLRKALLPTDGLTERRLDEYPQGVCKVKATRPRRRKPHGLYWGILAIVADNCDFDTDQLHQLVKHATGYSKNVQRKNGERITLYGSIAFDAMDNDEFRVFLDNALAFIADEILPAVDPNALLSEARTMCGKE